MTRKLTTVTIGKGTSRATMVFNRENILYHETDDIIKLQTTISRITSKVKELWLTDKEAAKKLADKEIKFYSDWINSVLDIDSETAIRELARFYWAS